jgi:uncharacterized GH25 family protein
MRYKHQTEADRHGVLDQLTHDAQALKMGWVKVATFTQPTEYYGESSFIRTTNGVQWDYEKSRTDRYVRAHQYSHRHWPEEEGCESL